jgi:hypothetical protein
VLGIDWVVRMLLTATTVDVNDEQIGNTFFLEDVAA